MLSTGYSFLILGVVVVSVASTNVSTPALNSSNSDNKNESIPVGINFSATSPTPLNVTNSTIMSSTANQNASLVDGQNTTTTMAPSTSAGTLMSTISTTEKTKGDPKSGASSGTDKTGIIVLVIIILIAVLFGVVCFCMRKKGRRYSVDQASRGDDTNVPLSFMEPEVPANAFGAKNLQTFEPEEAATTRPQEWEHQGEKKEAELGDPRAETAALALIPESPEDKPTVDVTNQSPPGLMEVNMDEKTDDEAVSNKTSVESLKEKNENHSNNVYLSQHRDLKQDDASFLDIPLDNPV